MVNEIDQINEPLQQLLKLFVMSSGACEAPQTLQSVSSGFETAVRELRLMPLFGKWTFANVGDSSWLSACRKKYLLNVSVAEGMLREGCRLWSLLEERDVGCLAMKGPFAGSSLYGDCALRRCMDIDLLVRPQDAWRAFEIARNAGYQLRAGGMSAGFYRRHHLHWSMQHEQSKQWLDLHWRLDHPFSLQRIEVERLFDESEVVDRDGHRWREAEPNRMFLMLCAQLWKECAGRRRCGVSRPAVDLLAFLVKHQDALEMEWITKTACCWRLVEQVSYAADTLRRLWHVDLGWMPGCEEVAGVQNKAQYAWIGERMEQRAIFRSERVAEMMTYLWPPRGWFGKDISGADLLVRRTMHAGCAGIRVASAAAELTAGMCMRGIGRHK